MIKIISTNTTIPDMETLSVSGKVTPESSYIQLLVTKSELTSAQKTIYTNGMSVLSGNSFTNVNNVVAEINIDRITSESLTEDIIEIDYDSLTTTKKNKVNALLSLFEELSTIE